MPLQPGLSNTQWYIYQVVAITLQEEVFLRRLQRTLQEEDSFSNIVKGSTVQLLSQV